MNSLPPLSYTFNIASRDQLAQTSFGDLLSYRKQLDDDLSILFNSLKKLNADMNTSLLTLDNYPRNDIDVASIRICRSKIIKLQNDYKWINETILDKMNQQLSASSSSSLPTM